MKGQIKVTDFEVGSATVTKSEMTEINAQVKVTHVYTAGEIIGYIMLGCCAIFMILCIFGVIQMDTNRLAVTPQVVRQTTRLQAGTPVQLNAVGDAVSIEQFKKLPFVEKNHDSEPDRKIKR